MHRDVDLRSARMCATSIPRSTNEQMGARAALGALPSQRRVASKGLGGWASRQMPMEMEIMLFSMPQIMPPIWGEIMPNYALIVELCRIVL